MIFQKSKTLAPCATRSILIVNNDVPLCVRMEEVLAHQGFEVKATHNGVRALSRILDEQFDLIILDSDLRVLDGLGILHEIRMRSAVRVLMLVSPDCDCLSVLDAGGDDFLVKPFHFDEFVARVHAVLRRAAIMLPNRGCIGCAEDLLLNLETHEAALNGVRLELTNVEFAILKCLLRSPGRIVSRDEIAAVLYHRESTPFERTIDVHISHLRKKIERHGRNPIRTIRGVGYLFTPLPFASPGESPETARVGCAEY